MTRSSGGPGGYGGKGGRGSKALGSRESGEDDGSHPADDPGSAPPGGGRFKKIASSANSQAGGAYQGAMEATFSIVVALGIGFWADSHFGTSPRWLIVGVIVGFGAFVLRLARMVKLVAPRDADAPDAAAEDAGAGADTDEDTNDETRRDG